jgi:hypothetical protein
MSVKMLLNSMDSRELTEWAAYITLENEDKAKKPEDVTSQLKQQFGYDKR